MKPKCVAPCQYSHTNLTLLSKRNTINLQIVFSHFIKLCCTYSKLKFILSALRNILNKAYWRADLIFFINHLWVFLLKLQNIENIEGFHFSNFSWYTNVLNIDLCTMEVNRSAGFLVFLPPPRSRYFFQFFNKIILIRIIFGTIIQHLELWKPSEILLLSISNSVRLKS